ncbi:hypothetical protein NHX12_029497 [Muraenolepis orangiensis]|uniref:Ig-like domain-containing protein n=1 Tax=Muraenolepis orangiensis TaxID=630683 RepID=A0A9Q0D931_9TELE|nr:hypothetical protein NHX12_029497 [Muraenolepis orangiensis]
MELACHVTNITHLPPGGLLGVTWEHTPPPGAVLQAAHAIGSLDYRGNLLPGPGYSDRLDSGVMSLTRVQPNTFKLHLLKTQEVDMGQYGCSVSAWVQDRQGAAGKLSESLSPPLTVTWTPKRPSLSVAAQRVREASVGGATFEMSCTVASQNLEEAAYSVLVQSQESVDSSVRTIMTLSPDNVLQHGGATDPNRRDSLMLTKSGPLEFSFRLAGVQLADRGFYWCDIAGWTKQHPGHVWHQATSPSLSVAAQRVREASVGGATFEMSCTVASQNLEEAAYSVLVQSQESVDSSVRTIMTLSPDNVLQHGGATDPNRRDSLMLTKSGPLEFSFRLAGVQLADRGFYWCDIAGWTKQHPGHFWNQATSPSLSVAAQRVREASVGGATFEMSCTVASQNLEEAAYSVLVQSQESVDSSVRTIMTLSPDNVLQHGGATDPNRRDSLMLTKSGPLEFSFRLAGVQLADRGFYWCDIAGWTKQHPGHAWFCCSSSSPSSVAYEPDAARGTGTRGSEVDDLDHGPSLPKPRKNANIRTPK